MTRAIKNQGKKLFFMDFSQTVICRGHFPVSGRRCEIELKKPLQTGHFKPSAV
jgi:hypothetical protein